MGQNLRFWEEILEFEYVTNSIEQAKLACNDYDTLPECTQPSIARLSMGEGVWIWVNN